MAKKSEEVSQPNGNKDMIPSMNNLKDQNKEPENDKLSSRLKMTPAYEKPGLPSISPSKKKNKDLEIQKALIENFVNFQKVMTNLAMKFDELSLSINRLLQLFEISAKNFAEKYSDKNFAEVNKSEVDKEFIEKLDNLLDQNKTIAKGIMLIEEKIRIKNPPDNTGFAPPPSPAINNRQMQQIPPSPGSENRFRDMLRSKPLPKY